MTRPRRTLISLNDTPYYHCVSRCVRRAFLCGEDHHSGQSYEHRRQWIEDKLLALSRIFAIDLCAYAVLSNHYHVVLHVDADRAMDWEYCEVISRWHQLFKGTQQSRQFVSNQSMTQAERGALDSCVERWRERLMDISWFMRVLNESIARQANVEDQCTGRFWEGRFKCQALLDESALASCMAYVDLNPVRVGMAKTPETSEYTSVKRRALKARDTVSPNDIQQQASGLLPFAGNPRQPMPIGLPFRLTDYLELVDWTGRILRDDKRGVIAHSQPAILTRLGIEVDHWLFLTRHFESRFKGMVGRAYNLKAACRRMGLIRSPGLAACHKYFPSG